MSNLQFNNKIEAVLKEIYHSPSDPLFSKEETWDKVSIETVRAHKKKQKFSFSKGILVASMFVVLLVSGFFLENNNTKAFGWFTNLFVNSEGNVTQITQSTGDSEDVKNEDSIDVGEIESNVIEITEESMSLEQAQKEALFDIIIPSSVPDGFELQEVIVLKEMDEVKTAKIMYESPENITLAIAQTYQNQDFSKSIVVDNEDTEIAKIEINGVEAQLFLYKDGWNELIWYDFPFEWSVSGEIDKTNLIETAESLK
ncbi:DUF4367 domain-containing protein [Saliterribacillus persicus]|uniref:Uncharacterized protein DUF4367 n=1 Tax=Saliterribacillus persicus TaxID=930114 RepID=A0A368XYL6_9BACI|nr:DUF4367 domain-containing protein [Saliterribacillus persicus]RCW73180.1 uncharacterized protein DUF4367 [Saliterribacillus persicus]